MHVTQRMQPGVGDLRTQSRLELIRRAMHEASGRFGMQVVHFSVQGNHLHLIVEAEGRTALSRSMKALAIRIALGLNRLAHRQGACVRGPLPCARHGLTAGRREHAPLRHRELSQALAARRCPGRGRIRSRPRLNCRCVSRRCGCCGSGGERQSHLRACRRSTRSCVRTLPSRAGPERSAYTGHADRLAAGTRVCRRGALHGTA